MAHSITFILPKLNILHSNDLQNNIHISFEKKITTTYLQNNIHMTYLN